MSDVVRTAAIVEALTSNQTLLKRALECLLDPSKHPKYTQYLGDTSSLSHDAAHIRNVMALRGAKAWAHMEARAILKGEVYPPSLTDPNTLQFVPDKDTPASPLGEAVKGEEI